jgi:hypothetical protein
VIEVDGLPAGEQAEPSHRDLVKEGRRAARMAVAGEA